MALSIDNYAENGSAITSAGSVTIASFVLSGNYLVAYVYWARGFTLSSVTFGGVAGTLLASFASSDNNHTNISVYGWAASPQTANVVATVTGFAGGTGLIVEALSFFGAESTWGGATNQTNQADANSISTSITTTLANSIVVAGMNGVAGKGGTIAGSAGQTDKSVSANSFSSQALGFGYKTVATAGSASLGYTSSGNSSGNEGNQVLVEIRGGITTKTLSVSATGSVTLSKIRTVVKTLSVSGLASVVLTKAHIFLKSLSTSATAAVLLVSARIHVITMSVVTFAQFVVSNFNFEVAPTFTAATNTSGKWIDGTAAGASSNVYGWFLNKTGTVAAQFDTAQFHSGSKSMKLSTLATASFLEVKADANTSFTGKQMSLLPSTAYTLTFWMKTNFVSGVSNDGAFIAMTLTAGDGVTGVTGASSTKVQTTTGWTQYTLNFTTPSNCAYGHPELRIYGHTGTGTLIMDAWFDDLVLTPATFVVPLSFNMVFARTLAVTASALATLAKNVATMLLSVSASASVSLSKFRTVVKSLAVSAGSSVSLAKAKLYSKTLAVTATAVGTISQFATRLITLSVIAVSKVRLFLDGLQSFYASKYPKQDATYSEKYPKKEATYEEKYPS